MSITTYSELKTAVENWLHRAGESGLSDRVEEFIVLAEDKINLELNVLAQETSSDLTINAQTINLPTDFKGVRRVYISGSPNKPLEYITPANFWLRYLATETDTPKAFTIEGAGDATPNYYTIVFGPTPDDTYTGKLLYWADFPSLSGSVTTNWVLENARGLLLYGALLEASVYFSHPNEVALRWSSLYDDVMEKVKTSDINDRVPVGSPMARAVGVSVD